MTAPAPLPPPMPAAQRARLAALPPPLVLYVWGRINSRRKPPLVPMPVDPTGSDLLAAAELACFDSADLVRLILSDASPTCAAAVEAISGIPIVKVHLPSPDNPLRTLVLEHGKRGGRCTPQVVGPEAYRSRPSQNTRLHHVVRVLVPNPKRPGTTGHLHFSLYLAGRPLSESLARGVTMPDVRWDVEHGFIELEEPA